MDTICRCLHEENFGITNVISVKNFSTSLVGVKNNHSNLQIIYGIFCNCIFLEQSKTNQEMEKITKEAIVIDIEGCVKPDEDYIEKNLKIIFEKSSKEKRKANGRLIAVMVALLVIFLAAYQAWIKKVAVLAGILMPAVIMIVYGSCVVILARHERQKKALFEKHLQEVVLRSKSEIMKKAKKNKNSMANTRIQIKNESKMMNTFTANKNEDLVSIVLEKDPNKQHQINDWRNKHCISGRKITSDVIASHLKTKRFSIRQKLFRQNAIRVEGNILNIKRGTKMKISQRGKLHRMRSAP